MNILIKLIALTSLFALIQCDQVCYDGYGCFTNEAPFGETTARPVSLLPEKPSKINTQFYLYNNRDRSNGELISSDNIGSKFNASIGTKFIVHGFFNNARMNWIKNMKNAFLDNENFNVIAVDWSGGSGLPYTLATSNTQVVGIEIALLVQALIEQRNVEIRSFHCIGHSLGAHTCGYAGKRARGMARISGMDPAGPYFENTPAIVRLDKSDADFVDIIHTNALKLVGDTTSIGMRNPIGHVDFYPNGGEMQPGCGLTDLNVLPHCHHLASTIFYIDSIKNKCSFTGYPCASDEDFNRGECLKCGPNGCNRMGYNASPDKDLNSLYLDSQSIYADYSCKHNYQLIATTGDVGDKLAKGKFTVSFINSAGFSEFTTFDNGYTEFKSNSVNKFLVSLDSPLVGADIEQATVSYSRSWNVFKYEKNWMFDEIEIYSAETMKTVRLCPVQTLFGMDNPVDYAKCL